MYTLIIGNKNLSSWSMPWLRAAGIAFTEQKLAFNTEAFARGVGEVSPAGLVPVLLDDDRDLGRWPSATADRHPGVAWPQPYARRVRWRRAARCAMDARAARPGHDAVDPRLAGRSGRLTATEAR